MSSGKSNQKLDFVQRVSLKQAGADDFQMFYESEFSPSLELSVLFAAE